MNTLRACCKLQPKKFKKIDPLFETSALGSAKYILLIILFIFQLSPNGVPVQGILKGKVSQYH